ncbi:hypothetical protein [Gracilimonas amylolytica]|uniref:hypothetical protein n=1 Tax=Gracilimonas amylolytica TaxID=1749045 RepID=UPI001E65D2F3|nr:hypothetical protein [Gracilimonas amylolytica]
MMNNALTTFTQKQPATTLFALPILKRIERESRQEYNEMQEAFELMGWAALPDALKVEIHNDVRFMVEELKGRFSSVDPFVKRRRQTVTYWVNCYQDGICSLDAAIKALKVKSL